VTTTNPDLAAYLDNSNNPDRFSGGVRFVPVETPKGTFKVWTKRTGNNPTMKLLLLHGGPGFTHEYFEVFDSYLPGAAIEYYYYDQLGSFYSDQPSDPDLWDLPRFVEEVEQVRQALELVSSNFFLLGHSWGGVLCMEYALKYHQHLKGLIISNMMASGPAYNAYAHEALMPAMNQEKLAEIKSYEANDDTGNPRYMELLLEQHYVHHVLRRPAGEWPDPAQRGLDHINPEIYVPLQGPSELGLGGKLLDWDRTADLGKISVPTLVIGAEHDTMDPRHMEWMAAAVQNGRSVVCPTGSHMAMYDDYDTYRSGLIDFIYDVDSGAFA
jgi:proline iminopeptidase